MNFLGVYAFIFSQNALRNPGPVDKRFAAGELQAKPRLNRPQTFITCTASAYWLPPGRTAEIKLKRFPGMSAEPVVIKNLKYWAAPRNEGFVLMQNELEAYRTGSNAFEYRGTSGFMITVDMKSKDFAYKQLSRNRQ